MLTTRDVEKAKAKEKALYCGLPGMQRVEFGAGFLAFTFAAGKFNVQVSGWARLVVSDLLGRGVKTQ